MSPEGSSTGCRGTRPLKLVWGAGLAASSTGQTPLGAVLDAECGPVLRAGPLRQFVAHSRRPGGEASLHEMQIHWHRRWASTPSLASATSNASHPRSHKRTSGSTALFVGKGPEHQVARARGITRDVAHFFVPHLTDYDDVWVGIPKRPPPSCEGETDLRRDLDLAEALLDDFYGVVGRPHFSFVGIEVPEPRVHGRAVLRCHTETWTRGRPVHGPKKRKNTRNALRYFSYRDSPEEIQGEC